MAEDGGVEPLTFRTPRFSRPLAVQHSGIFLIWRMEQDSNLRSLSTVSVSNRLLSASQPSILISAAVRRGPVGFRHDAFARRAPPYVTASPRAVQESPAKAIRYRCRCGVCGARRGAQRQPSGCTGIDLNSCWLRLQRGPSPPSSVVVISTIRAA